jgi:hypothetical protein
VCTWFAWVLCRPISLALAFQTGKVDHVEDVGACQLACDAHMLSSYVEWTLHMQGIIAPFSVGNHATLHGDTLRMCLLSLVQDLVALTDCSWTSLHHTCTNQHALLTLTYNRMPAVYCLLCTLQLDLTASHLLDVCSVRHRIRLDVRILLIASSVSLLSAATCSWTSPRHTCWMSAPCACPAAQCVPGPAPHT